MNSATESRLDHRLVRALGHPLRQQILALLHQRVASPSEIAQELGEPIGNVSYHVKVLRENEAIELVETRPVRGAVEHFYRPMIRPFLDDEHWARLPSSARRALFANTVREIFDHVARASHKGGFDCPKTHVSWTKLKLDDQAYAELSEQLSALVSHALELEAQSLQRISEDATVVQRTTELAILHFHLASAGEADSPLPAPADSEPAPAAPRLPRQPAAS